jgi:ADP-ribose pyrophosphatase
MNEALVPRDVRTVYKGRVFTVQVESITLPKGHHLDAEIVRHPGSVVIIPVTDNGEIILVKQYRHAIGQWAWELPAGSLKPGEDVDAAARRECHEEVGLVATNMRKLGAFFPTPGYCDEEMNFYEATGLRAPRDGEVAHADEDEDIEAQPFSRARIAEMMAAGEVVDLKTVAGLHLLER